MVNHSVKWEKLEYLLNDCSAAALLTQGSRSSTVQGLACPHLKAIIVSGPRENGTSFLDFDECIRAGAVRNHPTACIDLDLASIIYTSGSTGRPKGVMLSHRNILAAARSITTYLENTHLDVSMNTLPLSFDYGLYQILMGFMVGGTVVLEKSFAYPYRVLETMATEGVTGFPGVPTMFSLLLRMNDLRRVDLDAFRLGTQTRVIPWGLRTSTFVVTSNVRQLPSAAAWESGSLLDTTVSAEAAMDDCRNCRRFMGGLLHEMRGTSRRQALPRRFDVDNRDLLVRARDSPRRSQGLWEGNAT